MISDPAMVHAINSTAVRRPAPPKFSAADAERAADEWGMNCGPGAIAAIFGLTLDQVRPFMGDFERKRYTNPTLMFDTLHRLYKAGICRGWRKEVKAWPTYGGIDAVVIEFERIGAGECRSCDLLGLADGGALDDVKNGHHAATLSASLGDLRTW